MYKQTENKLTKLLSDYLKGIYELSRFEVKTNKSLTGTVRVGIYSKKISKLLVELRAVILADGTIAIKMKYPNQITIPSNSIGYDLPYYNMEEMKPSVYMTFSDIRDELLSSIRKSVKGVILGGLLYA